MPIATKLANIERPQNYSASVWSVWKMAAIIAERGHTLIEPMHFLFVTFSLIAGQDPPVDLGDSGTGIELDEIAKVFKAHGFACDELLRRVQPLGAPDLASSRQLDETRNRHPVARSASTKRAFELAFAVAAEESTGKTRLRHLVGALLIQSKELYTTLGIDPVKGAEIASDLSYRKHRKASGENLTIEETERAVRVASAIALANKVFGNPEKAMRWLRGKDDRLGDRTPLSMLKTEAGGKLIASMLVGIAEGFFS